MIPRARFVLRSGAALIGSAFGAALLLGLTWNGSPSYPRGLWRVASPQWQRGDLVVIAPPAGNPVIAMGRQRGYLPAGWSRSGCAPLLKRVVAIGGDRVEVDRAVSVNGRALANSGIRTTDSAGRSVPGIARSITVPPGQVWVMSEHSPLSFDSRYFGALPAGGIRGRAELLWTP